MIDAASYHYVYIVLCSVVCFFYYQKNGRETTDYLTYDTLVFPIIFTGFVIFFIGLRPISGAFVDMVTYKYIFENNGLEKMSSPVFDYLIHVCKEFGLDSSIWFLIISASTIFAWLLCCHRLLKERFFELFLTYLVAFSTFAYLTNTIRNGMACGFVALGISFYLSNTKNKISSFIFFIIAYYTHKSSLLPIACFFVAFYLLDFKKSLYLWLLSILLSLTLGNTIANLLVGLGFDDKFDNYLTSFDDADLFRRVGFRWDFFLYSMMPIILGYYVVIKKGFQDKIYSVLISTYTLSNAFWVIVIRASYSDRFAYLSWFLYPLVLSYPLFKICIWDRKQHVYSKRILYVHLAFTLFMVFVFYG